MVIEHPDDASPIRLPPLCLTMFCLYGPVDPPLFHLLFSRQCAAHARRRTLSLNRLNISPLGSLAVHQTTLTTSLLPGLSWLPGFLVVFCFHGFLVLIWVLEASVKLAAW